MIAKKVLVILAHKAEEMETVISADVAEKTPSQYKDLPGHQPHGGQRVSEK